MPQLLSRQDESGWLTPSIPDILTQALAPLPPEDVLRAQLNTIQRQLSELGTPVRIVDVRPSPSRTLFIAQPEHVGRLGNRRAITPNDVRRSLGTLAEQHPDWTLGLVLRLPEDDSPMGILMRDEQNHPLALRQIIISNTYLNRPSTFAVIIGIAIQQQAVIRDLGGIGSLLVVGPETRQYAILQILQLLLMMNTPSELRLALLGSSAHTYRALADLPHTLGKRVDDPENGVRLLDGMIKETERRRQYLLEAGASSLDDYNQQLVSRGQDPLPRIIILFDSLSDENWQAERERWLPDLCDLLLNGGRVGIHVLVTANQLEDVPESVQDAARSRLVMRSAGQPLADSLKHLHNSALRFVDVFFVPKDGEVMPLELCAVTSEDVERLVNYWQHMAAQRVQDNQPREAAPAANLPATSPLPQTAALARAALAFGGSSDKRLFQQAQSLAAYLGWVGISPLRDILGISQNEASAIIEQLQQKGVIENGSGPVLRFLRLADNPLAEGDTEA